MYCLGEDGCSVFDSATADACRELMTVFVNQQIEGTNPLNYHVSVLDNSQEQPKESTSKKTKHKRTKT